MPALLLFAAIIHDAYAAIARERHGFRHYFGFAAAMLLAADIFLRFQADAVAMPCPLFTLFITIMAAVRCCRFFMF